jgi:hypothetical protein
MPGTPNAAPPTPATPWSPPQRDASPTVRPAATGINRWAQGTKEEDSRAAAPRRKTTRSEEQTAQDTCARSAVMSGGAGYGERAALAAGARDLRIPARTSVVGRASSEISRLGLRPPAPLTLTATERVAATARTLPPTPLLRQSPPYWSGRPWDAGGHHSCGWRSHLPVEIPDSSSPRGPTVSITGTCGIVGSPARSPCELFVRSARNNRVGGRTGYGIFRRRPRWRAEPALRDKRGSLGAER